MLQLLVSWNLKGWTNRMRAVDAGEKVKKELGPHSFVFLSSFL